MQSNEVLMLEDWEIRHLDTIIRHLLPILKNVGTDSSQRQGLLEDTVRLCRLNELASPFQELAKSVAEALVWETIPQTTEPEIGHLAIASMNNIFAKDHKLASQYAQLDQFKDHVDFLVEIGVLGRK